MPKLLNYISKNNSFNDLLKLQLKEPLEEKKIAGSINNFNTIKDNISKKVRLQYEENPYPRWRYSCHSSENKLSISTAVNNEIRPNRIIYDQSKQEYNILIAGCGTGQQILDTDRYQD